MKFLVIGGDAAGMSAASRAKRNRPDLEVTVLEKTEDVSYSACGMPYNIADAGRPIDDLVVREARVFREKQGINILTGHCVQGIDPSAQMVTGALSDGKKFEYAYDQLLIATGGSAVVPDLPGFDLPGVMVLKSLNDGRKIKAHLKTHEVKRAVIIGMGYVGLEMCEALRARDIATTMIKPGPVFLPWMDAELSKVVREELESNGARVYAGRPIERIESEAERLKVIGEGVELEAEMVVVAVGIKPNSELAAAAGIACGVKNAIAVDRRLRTSAPNIYAAGDCADAYHLVTNAKTYIPLALRANRAGWAVADNVCGKPVELPGIVGTAVFKVFDLEVARTGLSMREAQESGFDPASVVIKTRSRAHAHPGSSPIRIQMIADKNSKRLLGVQMVGKEGVAHRINAAAVALHNRMTVAEFAQTDLAYAPPFGPVWDPLLTTANQLLKRI